MKKIFVLFCFLFVFGVYFFRYYGKTELSFQGFNGHLFTVRLIHNNALYSQNPRFPAISITTDAPLHGWIHIVHTDSKIDSLKLFIDAEAAAKQDSLFPFYSYEKEFVDAPLWTYSFFSKPLSFWNGHAFAVSIDHEKKKIYCYGGILWGFTLKFFDIMPHAITPVLLDKQAWIQAWDLLQPHLSDYEALWV